MAVIWQDCSELGHREARVIVVGEVLEVRAVFRKVDQAKVTFPVEEEIDLFWDIDKWLTVSNLVMPL